MQNLRRHPLSGPCKCLTLVPALQFAPYKVVSVYLLPMGMHGYSVWVFFFFFVGVQITPYLLLQQMFYCHLFFHCSKPLYAYTSKTLQYYQKTWLISKSPAPSGKLAPNSAGILTETSPSAKQRMSWRSVIWILHFLSLFHSPQTLLLGTKSPECLLVCPSPR